jgi:hypothetical protein
MASTGAIGTGTTIGHSSLPADMKALAINPDGAEIGTIEANTLATEDWQEFVGKKLANAGRVSVDVEWIGTAPTLGGASATLTITFANGATLSGPAWLVDFSGEIPLEEKVVATVVFEWAGAITYGAPA